MLAFPFAFPEAPILGKGLSPQASVYWFVFLLHPAFALAEMVAAKGGAGDHFKLFWLHILDAFMNQRKDIRWFQGMLAG